MLKDREVAVAWAERHASFVNNGTRRLYERLGFRYVRPKGLKNCVVSIEVPPQP